MCEEKKIKEAILYLEHTTADDFNLENWQKRNRVWAIETLLNYIEQLQQENKGLKKGIKKLSIRRNKWKRKYYKTKYILNELESWLKDECTPPERYCYDKVFVFLECLKGSDE